MTHSFFRGNVKQEEIREKLRNKILPELEKEVWGLNDDMAAHPELGSHEFESSRKIVELLRAHGIEVEYPLEAYKNLDSNVIDLEFIAETKYLGHNPNMVSNNRGYEWSESANKNIEVVYENIEKTDKSDIGIEIGKNDGIQFEKIETAKKMLARKMPIEIIIEITGLSKEEIENIKN